MDRRDLFPASFTRLTLAVVTLGAATCGGGRSVPFDDLAGDLLDAECDFLAACGSVPDRATCLASIRLDDGQLATLRADIAAGTVVYDGRAAAACIDAFKSLASRGKLVGIVTEADFVRFARRYFEWEMAATRAPRAEVVST